MSTHDPDRVQKTIDLRAPRSRVWRAISSAEEFGVWFGLGEPLRMEGAFVPGGEVNGIWTVQGQEIRELFCRVEVVEPEQRLVFRWVPYEIPAGDDPATHPTTRIEFRLEEIPGGTRLTVTESGFAALPADKQYKRDENGDGWAIQVHAIARHVLGEADVHIEDRVARPPATVFEAIVDPARMAQYFISHGSARLETARRVHWRWDDVGAALDVSVRVVEAQSSIVFLWKATGDPTQVAIRLEPEGDGTKVAISELPFELSQAAVARALRQTQGWTDFCCCLKAYLEHGVDLRRGRRADVG